MTTDKLIKLQRLMTHANNLAPTGYKEIPIFTIKLLVYLALNGKRHDVLISELTRELYTNEPKIYRTIMTLSTHIYVYKTVKVNVNKPVNAFQLTSTGEAFIEKLCDIL